MMIHFRLEELTRSTCMQQTPHIFKPNDNIVPKISTLFLFDIIIMKVNILRLFIRLLN